MPGLGIRIVMIAWLVAPGAHAEEVEAQSACFEGEVVLHVRAQFEHYGPRSEQIEFFGFIYRKDGRVESAVTRGTNCGRQSDCVVNPVFALRRIPKGAKVLGEWHTHPRIGTRDLSLDDVRGANENRHIPCYSAYYSSPDGEIFRWNIAATSVAAAMASLTPVGKYRAQQAKL